MVGPNGSGKTSFLRLLVGAERPDRGVVRRAPGLKVGYVPQTLAIDHTMPLTVDRLLALADGLTLRVYLGLVDVESADAQLQAALRS